MLTVIYNRDLLPSPLFDYIIVLNGFEEFENTNVIKKGEGNKSL